MKPWAFDENIVFGENQVFFDESEVFGENMNFDDQMFLVKT